MTTAPANLLAVRKLLQPHLRLTAVEMGIVGDAAHRGGYHQGRDRVGLDDYSVRQSPRDKAGLSEYASALDVGDFELSVAGKAHNLRTFSVWLVAQCKANAADTRDIREIIYSPDGRTVTRWDRLGKSTTGDSSHLSHTHVSYFRDATKDGRDLTGPYRRYLHEIGLTAGEDDDVSWTDPLKRQDGSTAPAGTLLANGFDRIVSIHYAVLGMVPILEAVAAKVDVDAGELSQIRQAAQEGAQAALATLSAEDIAAAIPADLAEQVADKLAERLQS